MMGSLDAEDDSLRGLIPRCVERLFSRIGRLTAGSDSLLPWFLFLVLPMMDWSVVFVNHC